MLPSFPVRILCLNYGAYSCIFLYIILTTRRILFFAVYRMPHLLLHFIGHIDEPELIKHYVNVCHSPGCLPMSFKMSIRNASCFEFSNSTIPISNPALSVSNVNYSATELPEHLKSGGIPSFFRVRP